MTITHFDPSNYGAGGEPLTLDRLRQMVDSLHSDPDYLVLSKQGAIIARYLGWDLVPIYSINGTQESAMEAE